MRAGPGHIPQSHIPTWEQLRLSLKRVSCDLAQLVALGRFFHQAPVVGFGCHDDVWKWSCSLRKRSAQTRPVASGARLARPLKQDALRTAAPTGSLGSSRVQTRRGRP